MGAPVGADTADSALDSTLDTGGGLRSRSRLSEDVQYARGIGDVRLFYALWLLALVTYGVADMWTTLAIIETPGLFEANPVVRATIAGFGGAGFAALKFSVLAVGIVYSADVARDDGSWYLPPALLAGVGTVVVVHNLGLLGL